MAFHGEPIPRALVVLKGRRQSVQEKGVDTYMSHAAFVGDDTDTVDPDTLIKGYDSMPCFVVGGQRPAIMFFRDGQFGLSWQLDLIFPVD